MTDVEFLLASDYVDRDDEDQRLCINFNDTWAWALAACRPLETESQIKQAADLYRKWGWPGLLYFETLQLDAIATRSEFEDINRFIEFVRREENLVLTMPDSNKRAYHKL